MNQLSIDNAPLRKNKVIHSLYVFLRRISLNFRCSAVVYLSFVCNYRCSYCVIKRSGSLEKYPKDSQHTWEEWAAVLNKLPSAHISITGGEPMLFPGLVNLINNLHKKHKVFLTTNLSKIPDGFLSCRKDLVISASFHPAMVNRDLFVRNINKLKENGFKPSVECVAYPEILEELAELKNFFQREVGVRFSIDPYISPDYRYTEKQIKILKDLGTFRRRLGFNFDGTNKIKKCKAGKKYFVIVPDGEVYACHAGFYYVSSPLHKAFSSPKEQFYLGNIFDGSFRPSEDVRVCSLPCSEGCDLDYACVREVKNVSN